MTKYSRHPWPTDGATKKQLDRQSDRLDRRIDHCKEKCEARYEELFAMVKRNRGVINAGFLDKD